MYAQMHTIHSNLKLCSYHVSYFAFILSYFISLTDYEFEDQFPLGFTVSAVSPFALRATWVASEYNCDLLGYKIVYNNGIGHEGFVQVDDPGSGTVLVEDLLPDTNYAIGIMPFNTREDLPLYGETNIYTLPLSSESIWCVPFDWCHRK